MDCENDLVTVYNIENGLSGNMSNLTIGAGSSDFDILPSPSSDKTPKQTNVTQDKKPTNKSVFNNLEGYIFTHLIRDLKKQPQPQNLQTLLNIEILEKAQNKVIQETNEPLSYPGEPFYTGRDDADNVLDNMLKHTTQGMVDIFESNEKYFREIFNIVKSQESKLPPSLKNLFNDIEIYLNECKNKSHKLIGKCFGIKEEEYFNEKWKNTVIFEGCKTWQDFEDKAKNGLDLESYRKFSSETKKLTSELQESVWNYEMMSNDESTRRRAQYTYIPNKNETGYFPQEELKQMKEIFPSIPNSFNLKEISDISASTDILYKYVINQSILPFAEIQISHIEKALEQLRKDVPDVLDDPFFYMLEPKTLYEIAKCDALLSDLEENNELQKIIDECKQKKIPLGIFLNNYLHFPYYEIIDSNKDLSTNVQTMLKHSISYILRKDIYKLIEVGGVNNDDTNIETFIKQFISKAGNITKNFESSHQKGIDSLRTYINEIATNTANVRVEDNSYEQGSPFDRFSKQVKSRINAFTTIVKKIVTNEKPSGEEKNYDELKSDKNLLLLYKMMSSERVYSSEKEINEVISAATGYIKESEENVEFQRRRETLNTAIYKIMMNLLEYIIFNLDKSSTDERYQNYIIESKFNLIIILMNLKQRLDVDYERYTKLEYISITKIFIRVLIFAGIMFLVSKVFDFFGEDNILSPVLQSVTNKAVEDVKSNFLVKIAGTFLFAGIGNEFLQKLRGVERHAYNAFVYKEIEANNSTSQLILNQTTNENRIKVINDLQLYGNLRIIGDKRELITELLENSTRSNNKTINLPDAILNPDQYTFPNTTSREIQIERANQEMLLESELKSAEIHNISVHKEDIFDIRSEEIAGTFLEGFEKKLYNSEANLENLRLIVNHILRAISYSTNEDFTKIIVAHTVDTLNILNITNGAKYASISSKTSLNEIYKHSSDIQYFYLSDIDMGEYSFVFDTLNNRILQYIKSDSVYLAKKNDVNNDAYYKLTIDTNEPQSNIVKPLNVIASYKVNVTEDQNLNWDELLTKVITPDASKHVLLEDGKTPVDTLSLMNYAITSIGVKMHMAKKDLKTKYSEMHQDYLYTLETASSFLVNKDVTNAIQKIQNIDLKKSIYEVIYDANINFKEKNNKIEIIQHKLQTSLGEVKSKLSKIDDTLISSQLREIYQLFVLSDSNGIQWQTLIDIYDFNYKIGNIEKDVYEAQVSRIMDRKVIIEGIRNKVIGLVANNINSKKDINKIDEIISGPLGDVHVPVELKKYSNDFITDQTIQVAMVHEVMKQLSTEETMQLRAITDNFGDYVPLAGLTIISSIKSAEEGLKQAKKKRDIYRQGTLDMLSAESPDFINKERETYNVFTGALNEIEKTKFSLVNPRTWFTTIISNFRSNADTANSCAKYFDEIINRILFRNPPDRLTPNFKTDKIGIPKFFTLWGFFIKGLNIVSQWSIGIKWMISSLASFLSERQMKKPIDKDIEAIIKLIFAINYNCDTIASIMNPFNDRYVFKSDVDNDLSLFYKKFSTVSSKESITLKYSMDDMVKATLSKDSLPDTRFGGTFIDTWYLWTISDKDITTQISKRRRESIKNFIKDDVLCGTIITTSHIFDWITDPASSIFLGLGFLVTSSLSITPITLTGFLTELAADTIGGLLSLDMLVAITIIGILVRFGSETVISVLRLLKSIDSKPNVGKTKELLMSLGSAFIETGADLTWRSFAYGSSVFGHNHTYQLMSLGLTTIGISHTLSGLGFGMTSASFTAALLHLITHIGVKWDHNSAQTISTKLNRIVDENIFSSLTIAATAFAPNFFFQQSIIMSLLILASGHQFYLNMIKYINNDILKDISEVTTYVLQNWSSEWLETPLSLAEAFEIMLVDNSKKRALNGGNQETSEKAHKLFLKYIEAKEQKSNINDLSRYTGTSPETNYILAQSRIYKHSHTTLGKILSNMSKLVSKDKDSEQILEDFNTLSQDILEKIKIHPGDKAHTIAFSRNAYTTLQEGSTSKTNVNPIIKPIETPQPTQNNPTTYVTQTHSQISTQNVSRAVFTGPININYFGTPPTPRQMPTTYTQLEGVNMSEYFPREPGLPEIQNTLPMPIFIEPSLNPTKRKSEHPDEASKYRKLNMNINTRINDTSILKTNNPLNVYRNNDSIFMSLLSMDIKKLPNLYDITADFEELQPIIFLVDLISKKPTMESRLEVIQKIKEVSYLILKEINQQIKNDIGEEDKIIADIIDNKKLVLFNNPHLEKVVASQTITSYIERKTNSIVKAQLQFKKETRSDKKLLNDMVDKLLDGNIKDISSVFGPFIQ